MITRVRRIHGQAFSVLLLLALPLLLSAERRSSKPAAEAAPAESVEMFAAMKSGDIEVKLIPKDDTEAQVKIKNNTDRPLTVRLPDAFAGVPVLAQARATASGGNSNKNRNQGVGGGMGMGGMGMGGMGMGGGGMGMGGGGMGGGGGFFNIAPEAEGQFKVETVCLEHGKATPRSHIKYEIKPIDSFTSDPALQEFLKLFGRNQGRMNHQAAQAAAWHLSNHMSWEKLAAKQRNLLYGRFEPYFTPQQLQAAMVMVDRAATQARERAKQYSSSSSSLSQAQ